MASINNRDIEGRIEELEQALAEAEAAKEEAEKKRQFYRDRCLNIGGALWELNRILKEMRRFDESVFDLNAELDRISNSAFGGGLTIGGASRRVAEKYRNTETKGKG